MNFLQSFINNTFNERQPKYKNVLDPDKMDELKRINFNKEHDNLNHTCPITMKRFEHGDNITILPCKHLFNNDSIEEWLLNNQAKCPVCRYELKNTKEICTTPELLPRNIEQQNNTQNYDEISGNLPQLNAEWHNWRFNNIRQYSDSNGRRERFSQMIRNILANNSINEIFQNSYSDISNNISEETTDDTTDDTTDETTDETTENSSNNAEDPIYNNINRYVSMLNNIINRQVQEEENDIMQEAILASLQDQ